MLRRDKLKAPILIPFSIVLLLALSILLVTAYRYEEHARQYDLKNSVHAVKQLFNLQVNSDASKLHATLCPISRDETIKSAFIKGDIDSLMAITTPLFTRLHDQHRITHFYILDSNRRVIFRAHQPDMSGDIINRTTTIKAQETGHETYGIELGPLGTLTLRAVKPWYHNEQLIGYLELGEEIEHITQDIHDALGVDLLVLVYRRFMMYDKQADASPDHNKPVIISSTFQQLPVAFTKLLKEINQNEDSEQQISNGKQLLYTSKLPLRDASEREIGNIMVIRDVTLLQKGFRNSLTTATGLSLLAGIIVFGLFYIILDRVEKDYLHQREIETQFAKLSTEHQRIVQIEKLSEVGRTIGEIAHQINNPLVGVINLAQLAEREVENPLRVRQLLKDIAKAGAHCHAFLQRMLAFTKVSRSERKPTDISLLINDTIALFQQSTDKHSEIKTDLPESPLILNIDPVLIRHALFNLLANAAQFNPSNGLIQIRLQHKIDDNQHDGWSLQVIDQGPGLSSEVQNNLFTPFYTTQANGTGLGLAVVQHVAMLHDGIASGENYPEGGAVFALWLPYSHLESGKIS